MSPTKSRRAKSKWNFHSKPASDQEKTAPGSMKMITYPYYFIYQNFFGNNIFVHLSFQKSYPIIYVTQNTLFLFIF